MSIAPKVRQFMVFLLGLAATVTGFAEPPSHAPAHGWRAKHNTYYVGYMGKRWHDDYGIRSGRCNREAVATVLGGIVGATIGSEISDDGHEAVAIIIGAAAGALIGNKIGRELDEADRSCFGHALEIAEPGQVVTWTNSETGVKYEMALGRNSGDHGDSCRRYMLLGTVGHTKSFRQGIACQTEPGVWDVVTAATS
jgi:surface antigen